MATTARPSAPVRVAPSSEVQKSPRVDQAEEHPGRGCEVLRPAGHLAALLHSRRHARRGHDPRGARLRRVVHPRLPGDQRERHAPVARRLDRLRRSGALGPDALAHLRHLRSADAGALLPRSAVHRLQGRGVPQDHRHRDHVVLGAEAGVLHLQLGAVRPERQRGLLPHRLGGGGLELGPERRAQPGPPSAAQGGLLPGAAGRPAAGCALQDHAGADRGGGAGRGAAPRGGDRGPGGDRLPVRDAGADGGPAPGLQVHRQERLP